LGPQQLKYMTFLKDSSDCFAFSFCLLELETKVEEEEDDDNDEICFAWENDLTLFLTWFWSDFRVWFHLHIPWSFNASTTATLAAAAHALLVELILPNIDWFLVFFMAFQTTEKMVY